MKNILLLIFGLVWSFTFSQLKKTILKKKIAKTVVQKTNDFAKIKDSVAALIPFQQDGKFGFKNQKGKILIKPVYSNVGFFTEDCNLQNSHNEKVRKFGSAKYASARLNGVDYRIDQNGKRLYQFKDEDLGKCESTFKKQLFHGIMKNGFFGIIEDSKFQNPADYRHYAIYPQYNYVHVLEGDDLKNPMIIASVNDRFGIIDVHNRIIIPFQYADIKPNYSWKQARLFQVSTDGKNYFYVDRNNKTYR